MQHIGDAAQHTQRMTFVAGRLQPADLLLGGLEPLGEVLLRKAGLLAQRGDLQRYVPGFAGTFKSSANAGSLNCFSR
jgi:hypothetical protein